MNETTHRESVQEVWNQWASDGRADGLERGHRDAVLQLLDRAAIAQHHHVLDLGCGTGWTVRLVAGLTPNGRAYGLDDAAEMIELARAEANPANIAFSKGAVEQLPYGDASLHRVISMESVYYWPDIEAAFAEIARVLMPGGRTLLAMNYWTDNPYVQDWPEQLGLELRAHTAAEYEAMLTAAGLVDVYSEQLVDRRPRKTPEQFKPSKWMPDYDTYLESCEVGTLLIAGQRAGVEPPPEPPRRSDGEAASSFTV